MKEDVKHSFSLVRAYIQARSQEYKNLELPRAAYEAIKSAPTLYTVDDAISSMDTMNSGPYGQVHVYTTYNSSNETIRIKARHLKPEHLTRLVLNYLIDHSSRYAPTLIFGRSSIKASISPFPLADKRKTFPET
ncbi:hypothetical protein CHS0354_008008 [Potamilus streckersoni]|uniref:Uncharacterized protein n=1 Tax=Potamilus streckersoni TaxID=2493646 RepID=A0AAE0SBP6_9BIVA|nr:hypothetical protein CHS0354_008008 [Potamilus streckersoni]